MQQGRRLLEAYLLTGSDGAPMLLGVAWTASAQLRTSPGGELLLDFTPYLGVDPVVPNRLVLDVPGTATATVQRGGEWELVLVPVVGGPADALPILRGPVLLERAVVEL